ncbi:adenine phosphoribosyltransferase [methanogenic archaeon mixed culture ISO4-G1]|nr:adenine phosphoribosyltransferase [methanogenic archaeon mixed culture ISO4-G1]
METRNIEKAYLDSKIVMKGDYPYFINSISDGNPPVTRELLDEIVGGFQRLADMDTDVYLAPEAMGIPIASALTMRTGVPFQIIRKRGHGTPGEIVITKSTGYETSKLYVSSIEPGTKVILVDDVLSTGGTMEATVKALRDHGIIVERALVVLNKSPDIEAFSKKIDLEICSLIDVGVEDGKPVIKNKKTGLL